MKKLIALIMCLTLVVSLCACGSSPEEEAAEEFLDALGELEDLEF